MKQLELREYTRTELAAITGRNVSGSHFSRDVQEDLRKWGYEAEWIPRRGARITRRPETAKERLSELMIRQFGLDIQIDVEAFARFIFLLLTDELFACMPWEERARIMNERFAQSIDGRTLSRWAKHLLNNGNLEKFEGNRIYWRTTKHQGMSYREPVDIEGKDKEEYERYKNRKSELINEFQQEGMSRNAAYSEAMEQLWHEFDCCYYFCGELVFNAISTNIDELTGWATEICTELDSD